MMNDINKYYYDGYAVKRFYDLSMLRVNSILFFKKRKRNDIYTLNKLLYCLMYWEGVKE